MLALVGLLLLALGEWMLFAVERGDVTGRVIALAFVALGLGLVLFEAASRWRR